MKNYVAIFKVHIFWKGHKIFTLLLSYVQPVKSKVKISQNYVAFSEYMKFIRKIHVYFSGPMIEVWNAQ